MIVPLRQHDILVHRFIDLVFPDGNDGWTDTQRRVVFCFASKMLSYGANNLFLQLITHHSFSFDDVYPAAERFNRFLADNEGTGLIEYVHRVLVS